MQSHDKQTLTSFAPSMPTTVVDALVSSESERQRMEFIHKYKKSNTTACGCISEISLEHLKSLSEIRFWQQIPEDTTYSCSSVIQNEAVKDATTVVHYGCIEEETLELYASESISNIYDDEQWIDDVLSYNQAL